MTTEEGVQEQRKMNRRARAPCEAGTCSQIENIEEEESLARRRPNGRKLRG